MAAAKSKAKRGIGGLKATISDDQIDLEESVAAATGGKDAVEAPKLRSYIERIERLEEEKAGIASDCRDVFAEAKSNGFCVKTMRKILKLRKMKDNERAEEAYMLDLYKRALGMQLSLDLEDEAEAA